MAIEILTDNFVWRPAMNDEIIVNGIVLYATLVGEYDKRLVVLTKERGKITIFANGARRPNSQFRAASQSFVMGQFTVTAGRDSYNLRKVLVKEYFGELAYDMEKMCYASYFCELMSYYTREGDSCVANLNLLYMTFKTLINGGLPNRLVKAVYENKLLHIEGQGIHCFDCVKCGDKDIKYIDVRRGGLLCSKCASSCGAARRVSESLIYTLQFIQSAELGGVYSFSLKEEILEELVNVTDSFLDEYVDKKFKSLEILYSLA